MTLKSIVVGLGAPDSARVVSAHFEPDPRPRHGMS